MNAPALSPGPCPLCANAGCRACPACCWSAWSRRRRCTWPSCPAAGTRLERADRGHRGRHRGRQHLLSAAGTGQRGGRGLFQALAAARRHRAVRPAPDLPGHRPRRRQWRADGRAGSGQHLRPGLLAGRARVQDGTRGGDVDRRRQRNLRCSGSDGRRTGSAWSCGAGHGGGLYGGGVRHAGDVPVPGAVCAGAIARLAGDGRAAVRPVHRCDGA